MHPYSISGKKGSWFSNLSITTLLIIINVVISILIWVLIGLNLVPLDFILKYFAITPDLILSGKCLWTLFTSMFVHIEPFHIFANMFSLFFVGKFLEKIIGRKRFFWIYIASGIIGGLFFVAGQILLGNIITPGVGASGAIFGLVGVLAVLVPFSRIYLIVGPLLLIIAEVILSSVLHKNIFGFVGPLITVLFILMLFSMISFNRRLRRISIPLELPMWLLPIIAIVPLVIVGLFVELPIANSAHFGGLVIGLIYGFYLRKKFPNKTKRISQMFR
ncbi:Rhomboid protease GlpG [uncultured archaeon]|nr:Rhomboid protease GlpG [uncultured archaeon]